MVYISLKCDTVTFVIRFITYLQIITILWAMLHALDLNKINCLIK